MTPKYYHYSELTKNKFTKFVDIALSLNDETIDVGHGRVAITAILLDKNANVISIGRNSYTKTHALQAKFASNAALKSSNDSLAMKVFPHAEIIAISKSITKIHSSGVKPHTLIVARTDKNGNISSSCPCMICKDAIMYAQIKKVIHT